MTAVEDRSNVASVLRVPAPVGDHRVSRAAAADLAPIVPSRVSLLKARFQDRWERNRSGGIGDLDTLTALVGRIEEDAELGLAVKIRTRENEGKGVFWLKHPKLRNAAGLVVSSALLMATGGVVAFEVPYFAYRLYTDSIQDQRDARMAHLFNDRNVPTVADVHGRILFTAIGDSYESGVGTGENIYPDSVNKEHTDDFWGGRWVSSDAFVQQLANRFGGAAVNLAASGAPIQRVVDDQIDQIPGATNVLLATFGANTMKIIPRLNACILQAQCMDDIEPDIRAMLPSTENEMVAALEQAGAKAPAAIKTYVAYTNPVPVHSTLLCGGLRDSESVRFAGLFDEITAMQKRAAQRAGWDFYDPAKDFIGHEPCTADTGYQDITLSRYLVTLGLGGAVAHPNLVGVNATTKGMGAYFNGRALSDGRVLRWQQNLDLAVSAPATTAPNPLSTAPTTKSTSPEVLAGGGQADKTPSSTPRPSALPAPTPSSSSVPSAAPSGLSLPSLGG